MTAEELRTWAKSDLQGYLDAVGIIDLEAVDKDIYGIRAGLCPVQDITDCVEISRTVEDVLDACIDKAAKMTPEECKELHDRSQTYREAAEAETCHICGISDTQLPVRSCCNRPVCRDCAVSLGVRVTRNPATKQ
jgi:hypothetical protein